MMEQFTFTVTAKGFEFSVNIDGGSQFSTTTRSGEDLQAFVQRTLDFLLPEERETIASHIRGLAQGL